MENSGKQTKDNSPGTYNSGWEPKTIGIVSYITILGWIVALIFNNPKTEYASFHLRQSIGLILLGAATSMLGIIPVFGPIVAGIGWIFVVFLWLIAFLGALQEEKKMVPFVGAYFQELFRNL